MNFKNASMIDADLASYIKSERKITHEILLHINLAETLRVYAKFGYPSMFQYLTKRHGYGEDAAYQRLKAARLLKSVPAIAEKMQTGKINLSQACKIEQMMKKAEVPIANKSEVAQELIQKIEHKNLFETEKVLVQELQIQPIQQEKIKPQSDGTIFLQMPLTESQMAKLDQVKSLMSHQLPDAQWSDVLEKLCDIYLNIRKEVQQDKEKKSAAAHSADKENSKSDQIEISPNLKFRSSNAQQNSRHIPASIKRSIYHRAKGCCEMVTNDQRCESKYQLQFDHQKPFSLGGTSTFENIRLLCRTHNLSEAQRLAVSQVH